MATILSQSTILPTILQQLILHVEHVHDDTVHQAQIQLLEHNTRNNVQRRVQPILQHSKMCLNRNFLQRQGMLHTWLTVIASATDQEAIREVAIAVTLSRTSRPIVTLAVVIAWMRGILLVSQPGSQSQFPVPSLLSWQIPCPVNGLSQPPVNNITKHAIACCWIASQFHGACQLLKRNTTTLQSPSKLLRFFRMLSTLL